MIKIDKYVCFKQGKNVFYLLSINVVDLLDCYSIDLFDEENNPDGYQRSIQKPHRRKIMEYLINEENPILNTAIIAACDKEKIFANDNYLSINDDIRIVDGQHRVEAFKELSISNREFFISKFKDYQLPIILMEVDNKEVSGKRILEMETFININNKNKRVNTALAVSILEKIRSVKKPELYENISYTNMNDKVRDEFIDSICNRVTEELNNNSKSIWYKRIKTGDSNTKNRIISRNTFADSIKPIVKKYLSKNNVVDRKTNELVKEFTKLIEFIWNIIMRKWPETENVKYYNIQKGIGVYSIHNIFAMCIDKVGERCKEYFGEIIKESKVIDEDWAIGGKFSPLNSKSGIKEIEKYILNEKID